MGGKNPKKAKGGMSKVKLKNIKGGKMSKGKKTGSKNVVKARRKLQLAVRQRLNRAKNGNTGSSAPEITTEDVLDMIDDAELEYLKGPEHKNVQYLVASERKKNDVTSKRRRKKNDEDADLENTYESKWIQSLETKKKTKVMLPIKTQKGLEHQEVEEDEPEYPESSSNVDNSASEISNVVNGTSLNGSVVSTAMLLAQRRQKLAEYKIKIGVLSASFLEDPENRLKNLDSLLAMMETSESSVLFTVPKLAAASLLAVFQDVLPSYAIKHTAPQGTKLKVETRQLQGYEGNLLRRYKIYLQRLEKMVGRYCLRKKPKRLLSETEAGTGQVAMHCMCKLLLSHPYFNLSTNIINFIIPFLNNWNEAVRNIVSNAIKSMFRMDKRGEISYEIVRRINLLVKSKLSNGKSGLVRRDVLDPLLSLRIKEADLEKEKDEETLPKKKITFEQRKMLSKRQRKKGKDLVKLERELLEASAEENKIQKSHYLTEITKLVFTMYFRAIKSDPKAKTLSAVLEGLAKFAHIINIEFFDDLLKVLEGLLKGGELQLHQLLLCVATVLTVLDGQGAALTLDPTAFHKHLYRSLTFLECGKTETKVGLALRCVRLATGRKKMPGPRAVAFVKRLSTMSLQVEHQDAVAALVEIKQMLRLHSGANGLLDSDGSGASGVYQAELDDPDHSCASSSTMWELTTLMNHYHPWVRDVSRNINQPEKPEPLPVEFAQKTPEAITKLYQPHPSFDFNPPMREPRKAIPTHKVKNRFSQFQPHTDYFHEFSLDDYIEKELVSEHIDFLVKT